MLFNSLEFIVFLPIVFLIYWAIGYAKINDSLRLRMQNAFVLIASYMFYAWWDWRFLGLLFGMSFLSWLGGRKIANTLEGGGQCQFVKKLLLISIIMIDLMVLGAFKYYNFFVSSFAFGLQNSIHSLKIVLPLGISFFTFQAISYVVDVYKRKIEPTNLIDCLLYIGFFPKLLAGPIERPTNLIPQIQKRRVFEYGLAVDGMRQILWGAFKKIVVADNCAIYVNQVWGDYANQSGSTLLLAAILYTIQIYGDFSGYSDMAIGTAKLFGFRFRDNFLFPYFSRNVAEFWRRWHISLNTWFVDYVYVPLGGSRNGKWRTIRNTFVIFLLSGLWHGANWTYVTWGLYHALLFVPLILMGQTKKYKDSAIWRQIPQMLMTFGLVVIGWIIFRADSIGQAWNIMSRICSSSLLTVPYLMTRTYYIPIVSWISLMMLVEWCDRRTEHGLRVVSEKRKKAASICFYIALFICVEYYFFRSIGHATGFIYFSF